LSLLRLPAQLSTLSRATITAFVVGIVFLALALVLGFTEWRHLNWVNLPLHASIEMAGAAFALLTAYFLVHFDSQELIASPYRQVIAAALTVMGVLDGAHAMFGPSPTFVLLHTAATAFSGVTFALVLIPAERSQIFARPLWFGGASLAFIAASIVLPDAMPLMLHQGKFTSAFVIFNTLGAGLMLLASVKLLLRFRKTMNATELLFGLQCSLFGTSSLFLSDSSLWNFFWWESHFFRLFGHALALLLLVSMAQRARNNVLQRLVQSELENRLSAAKAENEINKRTLALTENYENLVTELPLGLMVLHLPNLADAQSFMLVSLNPSAERQLNLVSAEVLGKRFDEVFPGISGTDLPHRYAQVIRLNEATSIGELVYGDERLAEAVYSVKAFPLQGQKVGVAFEDISAQYKARRMKEEFVSIVSHELRTPLTSIRGSVGLVLGGVLGELPAKAKPVLEIASHNCERLTILINDLLDMEKIQSGKMEFQCSHIDLCALVKLAIEENSAYAEQFSISLRSESEVNVAMVNVDPNRLMQVIVNLLSNAVKFSHAGAAVLLRLSRNDSGFLLEVIDHGDGIPEKFKTVIFEKFSQAEAPGIRKKGGAGLGLNIAKAMVEKMGGTIGYDSKEGEGSRFYVRLPEISRL
jgi:signal transduction histidine kinase